VECGTGGLWDCVIAMKVKVYTTGGTIDKIYFDAKSEYSVGLPQIREILEQVDAQVDFEVETLFQKDSLEISDSDRLFIAERVEKDPCSHILITHGTDTMVETARKLEGMPGKVIVLVGSLTPARFKGTDADFNIGFAMGAVQALPPGVYITMNARIFRPGEVRKNRTKNRFEPVLN
jgi:L-asparaginase